MDGAPGTIIGKSFHILCKKRAQKSSFVAILSQNPEICVVYELLPLRPKTTCISKLSPVRSEDDEEN